MGSKCKPQNKTKCAPKKGKKKPGKGKTNKKSKKTKSGGRKGSTMTKAKAIRFYNLLKVLQKLNAHDFNIISQYLDENAYQILTECIHNSICSQSVDVKMREKMKKILWSKKAKVRYLADKSKPFKKKRKLMPQIGGNIGLIIASVLPMIYNFLKSKKIL